jgi:hypothetical protein
LCRRSLGAAHGAYGDEQNEERCRPPHSSLREISDGELVATYCNSLNVQVSLVQRYGETDETDE